MNDFCIFSRETYSLGSKHFKPYFAKTKMSRSIAHFDADIYDLTLLASATPAVATQRDPLEPIQLPDSSTEDDIEEPFNPPEPEDIPLPDNDAGSDHPSHT